MGPTKMTDTKPHPWKLANFPAKADGFCKIGCQFFFAERPNNATCKNSCDYQYRTETAVGYSDIIEEARLECRDGCDIAVQVCQAGYYCTEGSMIACPPGTYREAVKNISIIALDTAKQCLPCPAGRYRSLAKGKDPLSCTACPIGKFANRAGGVLVSDCLRCPAGKFSEDRGMSRCKCITGQSCDMVIDTIPGLEETHFFRDGVDYFRESVPYVGNY